MAGRFHWSERSGPAVNARRRLPSLVAAYFATGRDLLARDPSPVELHRLRLVTKQLRYTLELFVPCYGPGLRTRIAELRRVQQLLGEMNDSTATGKLLGKTASRGPQQVKIQRYLQARTARKARAFRKQWTEVFDAPGRERWWTGYLARAAHAPKRA